MSDLPVKVLAVLVGAFAAFLFGSSMGKNKYKKQAEEEIRKANNEAGKARAEAEAATKEKKILEAAAKAVSPRPAQKVISGSTKESILSSINEMIEESKKK